MTNNFLSDAALSASVEIDGNQARLLAEFLALFEKDSAAKKRRLEDGKPEGWRYMTALLIADEETLRDLVTKARNAIAGSEEP